jgi:hypothetical protein
MHELVDHLADNPLVLQCVKCKNYTDHHNSQAYFGRGIMCKPCLAKLRRRFDTFNRGEKVRDSWPN